MEGYVSIPVSLPENVRHCTFFSGLCRHELGYCLYLPPDYGYSGKRYPVHYHLHGWQGCETFSAAAMEPVFRNSETVYVFPNIPEEAGLSAEQMLLEELIPEIESRYRVRTDKEGRSVSGFSMGGGMAVYFAARHPQKFSEVIAYAGTFHHYYHKDFMTAYEPVERAEELYRGMKRTAWESGRNLLALFAGLPPDAFRLTLRIGSKDPLYCDSEVLHLHLLSLDLPHEYRICVGAGHSLADIL